MATRGFEFAYAFDGSTPTIVSWPMAADAAGYMKGDILAADSNGRLDKVTANAGEVTAVCMQTETDAVSDDDELMVAIVTSQQVWRCSMDATTTAAKRGYTKTIDVADEHTLDAGAGSGQRTGERKATTATEAEIAVARKMGISVEDYLKNK